MSGRRRRGPSFSELHEQLRDCLGVEAVARQLVPNLRPTGSCLRADGLHGNTLEGPRQAFSIQLAGPHAGKWTDFGAGLRGDLVDLIAAVHDTSLPDAAKRARQMLAGQVAEPRDTRRPAPAAVKIEAEEDRIEKARFLWRQALPIAGTLAGRYLSEIRDLPGPYPSALRFHPRLLTAQSGTAWPALLGAVTQADGRLTGFLRYYLEPGSARKAPLRLTKLMTGRCAGGAVWFDPPGEIVAVGEGIETGLSLRQALDGSVPVGAAGSVDNIGALLLPSRTRIVLLCEDGNPPGSFAAAATERSVQRLRSRGLEVVRARPPAGTDFDDLRRGRGLAPVREILARAWPPLFDLLTTVKGTDARRPADLPAER